MLLGAPATQLDKVNQKAITYLVQPKSTGREFPVLSASKRGLANSLGKGCRQSVRPWRLREHSVEQRQEDQLLSEPRRREIFLALVDAQDRKMSVLESRYWIAKRFRVSDRQIRRIECEGLDRQWPPL